MWFRREDLELGLLERLGKELVGLYILLSRTDRIRSLSRESCRGQVAHKSLSRLCFT